MFLSSSRISGNGSAENNTYRTRFVAAGSGPAWTANRQGDRLESRCLCETRACPLLADAATLCLRRLLQPLQNVFQLSAYIR